MQLLYLSYSSVSTYQNCPLSYKFRYVDRLPMKKTPALAFGGSLHGALEKFYSQPVPEPPTLEQLLAMLDESWESDGYADAAEESRYREHGRQVLAGFYETNAGAFRLPAAVEEKFRLELDGVMLSGVIDRLDRLESGGYEIIDYKTNRRLPARKYVERDLQLSIYHMACERVWGITPERVTMYYLVPNQPISVTRTAQHAAQAEETVLRTAQLIGRQRFEPTPNRLCDWCDYRALCPAHPDHPVDPARAEPAPWTEGPAGAAGAAAGVEDVARTVEEYEGLLAQRQELDERLCKLQSRLDDYCDGHGVRTVRTRKGGLTRTDEGYRPLTD